MKGRSERRRAKHPVSDLQTRLPGAVGQSYRVEKELGGGRSCAW
jgi:hypothetical protein